MDFQENRTDVEHPGHTYPAGAVCEGKLLICDTRQLVCITSTFKKIKFNKLLIYLMGEKDSKTRFIKKMQVHI